MSIDYDVVVFASSGFIIEIGGIITVSILHCLVCINVVYELERNILLGSFCMTLYIREEAYVCAFAEYIVNLLLCHIERHADCPPLSTLHVDRVFVACLDVTISEYALSCAHVCCHAQLVSVCLCA